MSRDAVSNWQRDWLSNLSQHLLSLVAVVRISWHERSGLGKASVFQRGGSQFRLDSARKKSQSYPLRGPQNEVPCLRGVQHRPYGTPFDSTGGLEPGGTECGTH